MDPKTDATTTTTTTTDAPEGETVWTDDVAEPGDTDPYKDE